MADVVGAFLQGHQFGQAEIAHQQQLDDNKLRTQVLKHQIEGLKIDDQMRARDLAKQNLELLNNQPAADLPTDTTTTQQPNLPSRNLAGVVTGLIQGRQGMGVDSGTPPPVSSSTPPEQSSTIAAPLAQATVPGTNPVQTTTVRPVTIPGVDATNGAPGVAPVSIRPRSIEDITRATIALKRAEAPPVTTPPGAITSQTDPSTGLLTPTVQNTNLPTTASLDAHLLDAVTKGDVGKQRAVLATMSAAARAKGQSLADQYASAVQDGDTARAQTMLGAMQNVATATKDPAVQAQLATLRGLEIQMKQAGLPGGANGATPLGVTGDEAIKDLAPDQQQMVKLLAAYKFPLPSGQALRTPYWQSLIGKVAAYDPSFDATQYQARQKLRTDFTSGQGARNIRSLNTAVGHLDTLSKAGTDLSNGSFPLWNAIANKGITAVGDPRVTRFNTAANAVESELASVFKGTGASDQEIKAWRSTLNDAQSPAQLKGAIDQAIELMNSRLGAMQSQWETGMGGPKDFQILNPRSKSIIGRLTGQPVASPQVAAAPASQPQASTTPAAPQEGDEKPVPGHPGVIAVYSNGRWVTK